LNADALTQFIASEIEPHAQRWEKDRLVPNETFEKAGQAGLCGLMVPIEDGGYNLPLGELVTVFEKLAYSDMGFAFALIPHNNLANAIAREATGPVKNRYLEAMLAGELLGAFLLTEPGVGSDASRITTRAELTGNRWLLNGEKSWVTNGSRAGLLRVYAQTEPGSGASGIAAFLVDADQAGVTSSQPYDMLGGYAIGVGAVSFSQVELHEGQLLSPPGVAYAAAMGAIGLARVLVAALCVGILQRALEVCVERLDQRHAFGERLADKQGLRWMLADVATDLKAARALTHIAADAIDSNQADSIVQAAHAKKFAARAATKGVEQCMQVFGADGLLQDHPLARHLAGAKMAHYLDGSTEVQNLLIAKALFK
jgi:alkylation response protein AidB-like acyl-CoA dehydrogenase